MRGEEIGNSLAYRAPNDTSVSFRQEAFLWRSLANLPRRPSTYKTFRTAELHRGSVVAFFATTASDGKTYPVEHFNLDVILSVGYRVNSRRGTQFRIWATDILRQHLAHGYTLNERRLQAEVSRLRELQAAVDVIGRVLSRTTRTSWGLRACMARNHHSLFANGDSGTLLTANARKRISSLRCLSG